MVDILADGTVPFTVAFGIMIAIGILEFASLLFGVSLSSAFDALFPDLDLDVDMDVHHPGHDGALAYLFGFLAIGKIPALMLLVMFLGFFGMSGYTVQYLCQHFFGWMLPAGIASIPATIGGAFGMGRMGTWLSRYMPRDASDVSSRQELLGATATIIRGEARPGHPAEAKARDLRGRIHHVLVEPKEGEPFLEQGDTAMILRQTDRKSVFVVTNDFGSPANDEFHPM